MANELAQNNAPRELVLRDWLEDKNTTALIADALAGYLDPHVFKAQLALMAADTSLQDCNLDSILSAGLTCARMGLVPGPSRHVAMIPRSKRVGDNWIKVVDPMPQWQGFKFLMEKQDGIKRVTPVLVHVKDQFEFVDGALHHRFDPLDDEREFLHPSDNGGKLSLRGAYLKIEHTDGEVRYHFMTAKAIERRRMCSDNPDEITRKDGSKFKGVWRNWYAEQCLKTVLRDAFARRAVSIDPTLEARIAKVESADDVALGNDPAKALTQDAPVAALESSAKWNDSDRVKFCAALNAMGFKYDEVAAYSEAVSKRRCRPSVMTPEERENLLRNLQSIKGAAAFRQWLADRAAVQSQKTPQTAQEASLEPDTPATTSEPANAPQTGNSGPCCKSCGTVTTDLMDGVCYDCSQPATSQTSLGV